ncbi:BMC domain-containing protein [Marinisporobacter balticus]|uniref:BMC domain-containing protein n=1 Tax=Marinisporobacter balticus TaxID=2018667 RepID=A0A4R2L7Q0_9FIRM|nr:BMC domain-containing protein [Marinisporobacter balticus]TCO75265.1 BMC domain-containing protein [Marinisporobacter balticus]
MRGALGLIETLGLATAVTALDGACKTAEVRLVGYEKVIGAGKAVSVTIHIAGDVAAVKAAVEAGVMAAEKVGTVLAHSVIPRPHEEVQTLINIFNRNLEKEQGEKVEDQKKVEKDVKSNEKVENNQIKE